MIIQSNQEPSTCGDILDQFIQEDEEIYEKIERDELFWWDGVAKVMDLT